MSYTEDIELLRGAGKSSGLLVDLRQKAASEWLKLVFKEGVVLLESGFLASPSSQFSDF